MKKITELLIVLFLLMAARPAEAILGTVKGYINPGVSSVKIGDKFAVKIILETGESRISAVSLNLGIDTTKVKVNSVVANKTTFSGVFKEEESGGVIGIYGISSAATANLPKGVIEVATINLEAVANGSVNLTSKSFEVVGPSMTNDYSYGLNWQNGVINVVPVSNGTDGVLKFRTTFAGMAAGGECASSWPVKVMVMWGNNQSKIFDVTVVQDGTAEGRIAYKGEVLLTGVTQKNNLAIFIKGKRTLQTKFGKNGQTGFYNQPGGIVEVTVDPATTPVNDFTKYPILVGDVTGKDGVQDGAVDGLDFVYVKGEVNKRTEGSNMLADLNGNCKLESQDLFWLMSSMKDKQEQMY